MNCVESVVKNSFLETEIILVDNASSDQSHKKCKEKFPQILLFENEKNIGMAGRNIGLREANGKFAVFLDSDTIVTENWLQKFIVSFKEHGPGLYQGKLLDLTDSKIINSAGNMINVFGLGFSRGKGIIDKGQFDRFEQISYTSGACTFSSTEIMKKIQVDPIFFLYHDDLDFGWRANLMGISSFYEPQIIVYHYGSPNLQWSKQKFYYLERNRWICLKSLYSEKTYRKILPYLILFDIGMFFFLLSKGLAITKIKSAFAIFGLRNDIQKKKENTEKIRRINDIELIKNFTPEFYFPENLVKGKKRSKISNIIKSLSQKAIKSVCESGK